MAVLGGCGGARSPWTGEARTRVVPLVEAWRPERPLVEVYLNGRGPYLFAIATGLTETSVLRNVAHDLGVRARPDRDPLHAEMARIETADLRLARVRCRLVDAPEAFGTLFGRPVAGALGMDVLRAVETDVDPGAGVVRFHPRGEAPPAPPGPGPLPLAPLDGGFTVEARTGEETLALWLATESPLSALRQDRATGQAPVSHAEVRLGDLPARRVVAGPLSGAPAGVDGVLGNDLLRGLAWRFDGRHLTLWTPTDDRRTRLGRFPGVAVEGVAAQVLAVEPGRLTIGFAAPEPSIPRRFWVRVDAGLPGDPRPVLVRLQPRAAGPVRAVLEHRDLDPQRLRAAGAALPVLDVVPLDAPCHGEVCLVY